MEIERKEAKYRPVSERVKDYKDVMKYLSDEEIRQQAGALVRQLVSCGFLVPVGGTAASDFCPLSGGTAVDAQSNHALASHASANHGGKQ